MNEQQGAPGLTAATYADMLDEFASECERIGQQQAYTIAGIRATERRTRAETEGGVD